jgi:hypothetical protein
MGSTTADLHLAAGTNTLETMFTPGAAMQFRSGSGSCALANGQSYQVTVWGNNGWGNVRASSVTVQF